MNRMQVLAMVACAALLSWVSCSPGEERLGYSFDQPLVSEGFRIAGQVHEPGQDFWDKGYAIEGQFRYWFGYMGMAIALGVQQWDVQDGYAIDFVDDFSMEVPAVGGATTLALTDVPFAGTVEGDALLIPIGGSLLVRPSLGSRVNLSLEAGLRLVYTESNVKGDVSGVGAVVETVSTEAGSSTRVTAVPVADDQDVEIGEGVYGVLAADLEVRVARNLRLLVGGGYNISLHEIEATWGDTTISIADASFDGFFGRAGLIFDY